MTQVDAIYQNGVFKPLQDVHLPDNQRVRLSVQPVEANDVQAWYAKLFGARPGGEDQPNTSLIAGAALSVAHADSVSPTRAG